jgi:preprotein translocase subunit SecY
MGALMNIWRVPELRRRLGFTFAMIALYRVGSWLPTPGVNTESLRTFFGDGANGTILSVLNIFAGGALANLSLFALGIMPYITASIIVQLMQTVVPSLEKLAKEGESGYKKITQYTRYLTVVLAAFQSAGYVFLFKNGSAIGASNLLPDLTVGRFILIVTTLTAGTTMLMWIGELITQRGVGNGMSILIFTAVISRLPFEGSAILRSGGPGKFVVVLLIGIAIIVAVVYMDQGQRRIPIQYAKRVVGRKQTMGGSTYLPLKVNQAGVIPIIFANSILYFPVLLASVIHAQWFQDFVNKYINNTANWVYMLILASLIVFFAYFYTAIQFDPVRTADNLRKNGGFIPGIRPGPPTADYLNAILVRITLPGSLFLAAIALIPTIVLAWWKIDQFPFGGTSILIAVGVALETMKQIESQLMMRHYEGFLS